MFFRQALLPISSLFISIAFLATGYGMQMTYIGLYLTQAGLLERLFCRRFLHHDAGIGTEDVPATNRCGIIYGHFDTRRLVGTMAGWHLV